MRALPVSGWCLTLLFTTLLLVAVGPAAVQGSEQVAAVPPGGDLGNAADRPPARKPATPKGWTKPVSKQSNGKVDIAKEIHCLAMNIYWEAAHEPTAGKYGVAHVTINRRNDPRWPDTVCGVVYQDRAFSWTIDHPHRKPQDHEAWEQAKIVANKVYYGLDDADNLWRGVTYYHADYVRQGIQAAWRNKLVEYVQVGKHIFYRPSYNDKHQKF